MKINFLQKPYPFIFNNYSVLVPALATFVLILFLKPLGFADVEFSERLVIALIISTIIAGSIILGVKLLQFVFPNYTNEATWSVGKEMSLWILVLFIITCIIALVTLGVVFYNNDEQVTPSLNLFLEVFLRTAYFTLGFSIIPILIMILFEQHNHQKKQLQKARQFSNLLKEQLKSVEKAEPKKEKMFFTSESSDVELQVNPNDVIFIQSEGNYVEIYYVSDGVLNKKLIRHRLKSIEQQLPEDIFFRCHNRYIVNTKRITNVRGNARGLYLELDNSTDVIPVSRSRVKAFKAVFEKLNE